MKWGYNNLDGKISLFNKRSDERQVGIDMASRADVLVSEILDSELLGEGLIPTLQHAHDNLLIQGYKTVPYKATTYGQLVESTHLCKLHDLFSNEANVADGIRLVPNGKKTILRVKQQQFAMHCAARNQEIQVLDEEAKIFYSIAPKWITSPPQQNGLLSSYWCDHWKQCVWFSKGKGLPVSKDEVVCMDATHSEISISYEFKAQSQISEADRHDSRPQHSHITLSPKRIAIYGDKYSRRSMLDAINHAKKTLLLCVIADDSVFLTVAVAHLSKTSHIISLFPGLREKGAQYLKTVADENGYSTDQLEVINPSKQQWTMSDTHQKKVIAPNLASSQFEFTLLLTVDLLIAEPFYFGAEGMLPWQGLQFW
ncbi:hypothetical protein Tco_1370414 [Tanacetum coccineum]